MTLPSHHYPTWPLLLRYAWKDTPVGSVGVARGMLLENILRNLFYDETHDYNYDWYIDVFDAQMGITKRIPRVPDRWIAWDVEDPSWAL